MTEVITVGAGQLRRIIDAFSALSWPAPRERMTDIVTEFGWTVRLENDGGLYLMTGDPTNASMANVLYDAGTIAKVDIALTERIKDPDAAQSQALAASARKLRGDVTSFLGEPVRARNGKEARYSWDLSNGGRVAVADLGSVVSLIVLQKRYADIERGEERHGIPDDRDAGADLG